jgi:hypothetical protein
VQAVHLPMPDIHKVLPERVLIQTYNYIQPLHYGWSFSKPNAFFMLEASFTSQFIGLGLVIEFVYFRRWWLLGVMAVALVGTFATTGVLLVLLSAPFLFRRYWKQMAILAVIGLPLIGIGAYASGWIEIMQARTNTVNVQASSFSQRFVIPYTAMWDLATKGSPTDIVAGLGAGATTRIMEPAEYNSISRSFVEYGFLFFILFNIFSTYIIFSTGVPFIMSWIVFVDYNFLSGNFHLPSAVTYVTVLASGYAIRRQPQRQATARPLVISA